MESDYSTGTGLATGLKNALGKAAALVSLVGTLGFYVKGFEISKTYYDQWRDNAQATSILGYSPNNHVQIDSLPWKSTSSFLGLSLGAGFTGIGLGRSRRRDTERSQRGPYYSSGMYADSRHPGSSDNFWPGYWLGSSDRSSSSSSSSSSTDNDGADAVVAIALVALMAAGAGIVSYKALSANFGE